MNYLAASYEVSKKETRNAASCGELTLVPPFHGRAGLKVF
jgi:hypothetical protein